MAMAIRDCTLKRFARPAGSGCSDPNGEKWIASRLLVDQVRQRRDALRFAVQGIRN
jgi:hypothetical protein